VRADDPPTEAQMLEQLTAHETRRVRDPARDREERQFIDALLKKALSTITPEERRTVADKLLYRKPSIDLEVPFEFGSDEIGPRARALLDRLGRTLSRPELRGTIFVIAGHTDAAGGDAYNQSLSERRAGAVKTYLTEQFKLRVPPTNPSSGFHPPERTKYQTIHKPYMTVTKIPAPLAVRTNPRNPFIG